jgi:serine protease AprX
MLDEQTWLRPEALSQLGLGASSIHRREGACPGCVQQMLLEALVTDGHNALREGVQALWPLDPEAAFGALPTPLRLRAHPRFAGAGVTVAFVDAGFYPHPDLTQPTNRIRAWADAGRPEMPFRIFGSKESPTWPGWDAKAPRQWHGLMTSVTAAGNGTLGHGLYRGIASEASLVLVQVVNAEGGIDNDSIARALRWLRQQARELEIRIVTVSVAGDPVPLGAPNPVDDEVAALVSEGVLVIAAAGNDGVRQLVPPATAPEALTVGGLDDRNVIDREAWQLWHSNYGETSDQAMKPEIVAPSLWVVAPVLPETPMAKEAAVLFEARQRATEPAPETLEIAARMREHKLVSPHYQHVEGTSFAAPIVASIAACMLQANPDLTPRRLRELLMQSARPVPGAPPERQGAGAVDAGHAVALAVADRAAPDAGSGRIVLPHGV